MIMAYLMLAAVAVVGLLEWLKAFIGEFKKLPGSALSLLVLVASALCGFLVAYGTDAGPKTPAMALLYGLVVLAFAQIGYDAIIKAIAKKAAKVLDDEKLD